MIRPTDFVNGAAWARPSPTATNAAADDPSTWFSDDDLGANARISAGPSPESRGLNVEQHAARVLAFLCGERDARS